MSGYMRVREAAEILRMSKANVYRLINAGEIAAVRVGRRSVRIDRQQFEAYLAKMVILPLSTGRHPTTAA